VSARPSWPDGLTVRARPLAATLAAALAAAVAAAAPARAHGQPTPAAAARPLAEQVARAGDGRVRFRYATREGVCGDGARAISVTGADGTSRTGNFVRGPDGTWTAAPCEPGPARVTLTLRGGVPGAVRLAVGSPRADGRPPDDADGGADRVVDLGAVPAAAAAAYLLDLAGRDDAPPSDRVLLGAVIADSSVVWPRLLALARAERLPRATRREAASWAGRFACDAVTAARDRPARADTADREVRKQVVFALSQRPREEGTAPLTRAARSDRDPAVRCAALFWLGEARGRDPDPRTLALFEEVLRKP
jgi:hypothetical protein